MVDVEIIKEWISKADDDFGFALINLQEGKRFTAQICFHFQQSAEKYLKAYIISHDLEFRKTHDLPALLEICVSKNSSFKQYEKAKF
jgi:HEPN domain-containing protein